MDEIVNLTPDIVAVVGKVSEQAAPHYLEEKFKSRHNKAHEGAAESGGGGDVGNGLVPLAAPEALPKWSEEVGKAIDKIVQCSLSQIDKDYPMVAGEQHQEVYASFLTEAYLQFCPGTPVLKRTTNMAEIYYLVTNAIVDQEGHLYRVDPTMARRPLKKFEFTAKSIATKAASSLVGAIASKIGGAIGSMIWDAIFPPGVPDYFDEVYKEMAKMIGQGLQQNTIDSINGAINSIKDHLITEYTPARKAANLDNKNDRKQLFAYLQKYDTTFLSGPGGMLGTLQSKQYSVAGFGVFLLGASLQLALFQEMANVTTQTDEKTGKWLKPTETSYGKPKTGTVALAAKQFADYAQGVWPKVVEARVKDIKVVTYEANRRRVPGNDVYWELWGAIEDQGEKNLPRKIDKGANKDGSYPTKQNLETDKSNYVEQKKRELTDSYSDPNSIIAEWRKLIDQPILLAS
ncbi:MAG TPA: insecticidal delta-endotoxin Cry8Ea1 family protein [Blastocatellia bacterium]|nr:insecticidal delta-endotoxin Cry8Ea1 family protein [Blastocatellia bacterium]